ncbi:DUF4197 domain-containing protein [Chryseobacterium sp. POL2]|uniref:DUF4197 family protein n=1 Tax=Chryseobacterium sp. POL2 TaxID=2713414 RepID=UPI0013E18DAA|nr:DUF4197 family protein [Chryseobacterium sp. POL2]QIG89122.1 DUF4197 domain-containing protein [Chryseobacterium sp. POL2]
MRHKFIITATLGTIAIAGVSQSCVALATSSIGLSIIKRILVGGISSGLSTFKDKNAFLSNNLIDQAMPSQLRSINATLSGLGLSSLVQKEKEYIAEAAAFTSNLAEPILINGVNSLTTNDAERIAQGGSGIATQILREKTESQLIATLAPKVDEKLNEYGIIKTINTALKGNNLLGNLFGGNSSSNNNASMISNLATQQMVNGLFALISNYEKQNADVLNNAFKK